MTAEFDAISLQTAQLLLLYQSVKVEKTRHGSPQETPQQYGNTGCGVLKWGIQN